MKGWILLIALAACSGDDTAAGTRALCAEGGALNDQCEDPVTTPQEACWRMVDCGAIAVHRPGQYDFDWDRCVDEIQRMDDNQQQIVIACIGASTCDQLKNDQGPCFLLGAN